MTDTSLSDSGDKVGGVWSVRYRSLGRESDL